MLLARASFFRNFIIEHPKNQQQIKNWLADLRGAGWLAEFTAGEGRELQQYGKTIPDFVTSYEYQFFA